MEEKFHSFKISKWKGVRDHSISGKTPPPPTIYNCMDVPKIAREVMEKKKYSVIKKDGIISYVYTYEIESIFLNYAVL
jgi:hypothetical protein